jgi:predicted Kef-type K+ transport protein
VIARRIGLPNIVGYMLAGIAIGPFTPGFVGDVNADAERTRRCPTDAERTRR